VDLVGDTDLDRGKQMEHGRDGSRESGSELVNALRVGLAMSGTGASRAGPSGE
jgi:hypothetical protein